MAAFTENLNFFASIGGVLGQLFIVTVFVLFLCVKFAPHTQGAKQACLRRQAREVLAKISTHGVLIGFVVSLVSVILSLVYSDIVGYVPCTLCWFQRIFLYPQVIIFGLALWKKTKDSELYCLVLSIIGAVIAGYHFYGQSINPSALPACAASGGTSCAVRYFVEFGYVTIPMMAFTAFLLIITTLLLSRYNTRD